MQAALGTQEHKTSSQPSQPSTSYHKDQVRRTQLACVTQDKIQIKEKEPHLEFVLTPQTGDERAPCLTFPPILSSARRGSFTKRKIKLLLEEVGMDDRQTKSKQVQHKLTRAAGQLTRGGTALWAQTHKRGPHVPETAVLLDRSVMTLSNLEHSSECKNFACRSFRFQLLIFQLCLILMAKISFQ